MTNLLAVVPDFDLAPFSHILPSLEKALISSADLLTLDAIDVAKRAQVPSGEVRKLVGSLLSCLGGQHASVPGQHVAFSRGDDLINKIGTISTLDDSLDVALNGGVHTGFLTEVTGESAVGKTQLLLTLLASVQLPAPLGIGKSALYISTESQLQTTRLCQILREHPKLARINDEDVPSLNRIRSSHIHDLEAQEHILRYQVPVAIRHHNVGLIVIDSVAANYRAEFDRAKANKGPEALAKRSLQVAGLGAHLRDLARTYDVAVVVANQVADRFEPLPSVVALSQSTQSSRPVSPARGGSVAAALRFSPAVPLGAPDASAMLSTDDPLALDHQQRFFTGWGDNPADSAMKTPSLGLTWTNQLATRIALLKVPVFESSQARAGEEKVVRGWDRTLKVVFSAWCASGEQRFEIWQGGIRSVGSGSDADS